MSCGCSLEGISVRRMLLGRFTTVPSLTKLETVLVNQSHYHQPDMGAEFKNMNLK